jgi:hypothetical protein
MAQHLPDCRHVAAGPGHGEHRHRAVPGRPGGRGVGPYGPLAVLAGIYILASLITEPMSNAAATVLIVPIAIDVALGLGAAPQPFVLATVIGASTSFLTPVGHQANVLVFGPGGYRFTQSKNPGFLKKPRFFLSVILLPSLEEANHPVSGETTVYGIRTMRPSTTGATGELRPMYSTVNSIRSSPGKAGLRPAMNMV